MKTVFKCSGVQVLRRGGVFMLAGIVLVLGALLLLPGCARNQTEKIGPVKVVFWHAMGGLVGDELNALIDEYNRAHPESLIVGQSMGNYGALSQKLIASIVAGNQPDIAQAYENWIAKFVAGDLLVPIDTFFTNEAEKKALLEDFFPVIREGNTYNGRLMSLPFNKSTPILYFNKVLFRKAGLDPDRPPETWEEFVADAKRLTRPPSKDFPRGVKGFVSGINVSEIQCFIHQNGGRVSTETNPDVMEFASPESAGAVRFLLDLKYVDKASDYYVGSGYEFQNDFLSQQSAMMVTSCVSRSYMADRLVFDWGFAPLPGHLRRGGLIYGTSVVMFKSASERKRRAAWEFIRWFNSPEIQVRWALRTGYLPVRKSCLEVRDMKDELKRNPSVGRIVRQIEEGFLDPRTSQWFVGRQNLDKALADIFTSREISQAYGRPDSSALVDRLIKKELDRAVRQTEKWFDRKTRTD
jgi:multiple sugar transport system substrate-binding protein